MSDSDPFDIDLRALSPEMRRLVEQIGKDSIAGDYHNPFGVRVDPLFVLHEAELGEDAAEAKVTRTQLPREAYSEKDFEREKKKRERRPRPAGKISPGLIDLMERSKPRDILEIIVTLADDDGIRVPLLPDVEKEEERDRRIPELEGMVASVAERRTAAQRAFLERAKFRDEPKVLEHFWITNAIALAVRRAEITRLARLDDVAYLQPVFGGESPPADSEPGNDAIVARGHIRSDPYFNLNLTNPWIGLIDTGVRRTHTMFNNPDRLAFCRDCVNGGTSCNETGNPGYDCTDIWPHGTSSAGILSGNDNSGTRFRGVTAIRFDSWRVYTSAGLDSQATIRAIQRAVTVFDRVLVGEVQASESETGAIATAADAAYDAGAVFVSANGNFGPDASTVRSPGIAHKVLGVGAFMTLDESQYTGQGRGPATDGRFKPDIQAPTVSETAHGSSDTTVATFSGTSGATPYASAAAMLARNWLRQFGSFDNGQTYALMILWGQDTWPYNNTTGAGPLRMGVGGRAWWGKVAISNGGTIDIPITIGDGQVNLDGALWWPESAAQQHNDIDLHLIDPGGTERARGFSAASVFERARAVGRLRPGTWQLRIRGFSVRTSSQIVYWAARVGN